MAGVQHVTVEDFRFCSRLVVEACELGEDATAWRAHVARELARYLRGRTVDFGLLPVEMDPARATLHAHVHYGESDPPAFADRANTSISQTPASEVTIPPAPLDQIFDSETCHRADLYAEVRRNIRLKGWHLSLIPVPSIGMNSLIGLAHEQDSDPFDERRRHVLHLVHEELVHSMLRPPVRPADVDPRSKLTDRQLQIVEMLDQGMQEKEIASQLGLSRFTVHDHVRTMYSKFRVDSRVALLAKFRPRPAFRPKMI